MLAPLRNAGIRAGLEAISRLPAGLQLGSWSGRGVILTLHHVRPSDPEAFQPNAGLSITPQFLDAALRVAMECGLIPIRLEDLPALLAENDSDRFFAVTLDDGYRDNAEFAAPVFRKHGVPYTIFVTSGFAQRSCSPWWEVAEKLLQKTERVTMDFGSGKEVATVSTISSKSDFFRRIVSFVNSYDEDLAVARIESASREAGLDPHDLVRQLVMDANELRELAVRDPLASFGAHTVTHCNLKRAEARRLEEEIFESVSALETFVGRKPTTFAYPYGWSSAAGRREAEALAKAGLSIGVTTQPGVLQSGAGNDNFLLPRISLNGLYQEPRFVRALISGLPFVFR